MDAGALSGGQVIDAPPTHLQEYKRNEQYPQSELWLVSGYLSVMYIYQISEPGNGSPRILRIPRPVMPPGLLGPQGAEEHADGHKGQTDIDQIIRNVEFFVSDGLPFKE